MLFPRGSCGERSYQSWPLEGKLCEEDEPSSKAEGKSLFLERSQFKLRRVDNMKEGEKTKMAPDNCRSYRRPGTSTITDFNLK